MAKSRRCVLSRSRKSGRRRCRTARNSSGRKRTTGRASCYRSRKTGVCRRIKRSGRKGSSRRRNNPWIAYFKRYVREHRGEADVAVLMKRASKEWRKN